MTTTDKAYNVDLMKEGQAECPVCNGTGKVPLTEKDRSYSWNKGKEEKECGNCGGQTMVGRATGLTRLRKDGTPCVHEYKGANPNGWRCYVEYTCIHCGFSFPIDSSD